MQHKIFSFLRILFVVLVPGGLVMMSAYYAFKAWHARRLSQGANSADQLA